MSPDTNIYLIGLMGAGKTTIGRHLARRLERPFLDSDHELESRTGVRIPTVFEIEGESGFRQREAQIIAELTAETGIVLATGGGVVLDPNNRHRLRSTGWVVYLDASPERLFERTRSDRNRPLLQVSDPLARLSELHRARDPLYREIAHWIVPCSDHAAAGVAQNLHREFIKQCKH